MRKIKKLLAGVCCFAVTMSSLAQTDNFVKIVKADDILNGSVLDIEKYSNNQIIIQFSEDVKEDTYKNLKYINRNNIEFLDSDLIVANLSNKKQVKNTIDELLKQDNIEYFQPNYEYETIDTFVEEVQTSSLRLQDTSTDTIFGISNDKYSKYQWGFKNDGRYEIGDPGEKVTEVAGIDINIEKVWEEYKGENKVIVAIIDTGVDIEHEDLKDKIWKNEGEIPGNGIDDDGNGFVDDVYGWNFYSDNNQICGYTKEYFDDETGEYDDDHGTHCAGTIIATANNEVGIAGIASNANVELMCLKAIGGHNGEDKVTASTSSVTKAIKYAEKMGAKICNLSVGGDEEDKTMKEAIENSNMLFIVASGNGNSKVSKGINTDKSPIYPACYEFDNIISVANINCAGELDSTSNYGVDTVDIAAPGTKIYSTQISNRYGYMTGTSMAAPMVTGVCAVIYSYYGDNITTMEVKEAILNSSKPLTTLANKVKTSGMLDAYSALQIDTYAPKMTVKLKENPTTTTVSVTAKDIGTSGLYKIRWVKGNKSVDFFEGGTKGKKIALDGGSFEATVNGKYTIYSVDNNGNESVGVVDVTVGNVPVITTEINSVMNSDARKLVVNVTDVDDDLVTVCYAEGTKKLSYFKKGNVGNKLVTIPATFRISSTKNYTFYAIDSVGNQTIKTIRVSVEAPKSISLNKLKKVLSVGQTFNLKVNLLPENAVSKYTFTSSNPNVATVSASGQITAVSKGTTVITVATTNGITANCTIVVK